MNLVVLRYDLSINFVDNKSILITDTRLEKLV